MKNWHNSDRCSKEKTDYRRDVTARDGRYQMGAVLKTSGNGYRRWLREDEAKTLYLAALTIRFRKDQKGRSACFKNLATSFERLGQEDIAAAALSPSSGMSPKLPEANNALAPITIAMVDTEEAARMFSTESSSRNGTSAKPRYFGCA